MTIIVIMGVSGSGKTTIGKLLAEELMLPFKDADDYHPQSNVNKMTNGIPLTDEDRRPWLELLRKKIEQWSKREGVVLACSALKESYRSILNSPEVTVNWIYLKGSKELIASRMKQREGHFMSPELLESQFRDLEEPSYALEADIKQDTQKIVNELKKQFL